MCFIWVHLCQNFRNFFVIFKISTLKFFYLQKRAKKEKEINFKQKVSYLALFAIEFSEIIVIFEIKTLNFACF